MAHEDRTIACARCGAEFVWSAGEQDFFARKGLEHPPRKCTSCRAYGKEPRPGLNVRPVPSHAEFIGAPPRRPRGARPVPGLGETTAKAACSACGALADLPFEPDGVRPVYCRRCYQQRRQRPRGRS